ncbi:MAG: hypothetical protein HRU28_11390 [Rhizobiales bacterium]|nr:hypothetical protein [Hyphomicrobiales bacterium]
MDDFSAAFYLEIVLAILMVAGIFYMYIINTKLKLLKNGGDGFRAVVIELNHSTENAKTAIQGLKLTVRDAEHGLDGNLKQARSVVEELKYLLDQANINAGGLNSNAANSSYSLRNIKPKRIDANRAKNFADQTLEKVNKQKRSLPNPIMHNRRVEPIIEATEPSLGVGNGNNLPAEHKEIALQRRQQAMRSIEEKNRLDAARARQRNDLGSAGRDGVQGRGARNPRPTTRQPIQRQAPNIPDQNLRATRPSSSAGNMSLSQMVGKHAEMERNEYVKNDELRAQNRQGADRDNAKGRSKNKNSLFDKLSRTR